MATEASSSSCSDMLGSLMLPSRAIGVKINNNNHNFVYVSIRAWICERGIKSEFTETCLYVCAPRLCTAVRTDNSTRVLNSLLPLPALEWFTIY